MQDQFNATDSKRLVSAVASGKVKTVEQAQAFLNHIIPEKVAEAFPRAVALVKSGVKSLSFGGKKEPVSEPAMSDAELDELTAPGESKK